MDEKELTISGKANIGHVKAGQPVLENYRKICEEPMKAQEELLLGLLADNKDTEYGKKYGFADIHSIKEFQEKVPVSRFDDYADYILRMTEDSEENLICAYPIHHYNKTSGTMGTPKRIPMSDKSLAIFDSYVVKMAYALVAEKLGLDWINNKSIGISESTAEETYLKNGCTYGAVSQKANRQFRPILPMMYTSPDEALFPKKDTNTRYLHARFALADKTPSYMSVSFYSFILELLRYIEGNWEMLCDDIEAGTIDASIKMPDEVRESLKEKLSPMPDRAAELREIFSQGFDEPFVPKVWPNLKFIAGIGTGGFKDYADKIKKIYTGEDVLQVKFGISASEGTYSAPFEIGSEDTALIPDGLFYEFLPLEAGDDFSQIKTLDEVEVGKEYEVVITTFSGFYRYRMRDAVRVTGKYKNTPTVQFLYRVDQTVSIMGEKTTEVALRAAAENTAKELAFDLIDFSVYPDLDSVPVRYQYFMEIGKRHPRGLRPKEVRYVLEQELAKANPSMGDKVKAGICGATRVNFLEEETYMLYRDLMILKGTASTQIKPVRVINNEMQRKFFFGLTDYSCEVMK